MRVALVSYDFGEYCVRLAAGLAGTGAQVLLLLPRQLAEPYGGLLHPRVDLVTFAKPRLRQPGRQLAVAAGLVRRIRAYAPQVLHLQQGHLWFNPFLLLRGRRRLVVTVHDPRQHAGDAGGLRTPQAMMDFGFRRADQLIVHGRALVGQLVDRLGLAPGTIHVIPHIAIGHGAARAGAVDEEAGTVLFFGRIWGYKGLDYLIRAEPRISARVPGARIVIAGQGEDFQRYRRLMVHPERFAVYNDCVSDERRAELFQRASVVVLPYVEASQSGVIPVAYAFGKPVVATAVGGLPDMVDHGRTGYLVPPRDEAALADAVVCLLRDEGLRRRLGAAGRRKLDAECAADTVARQTAAVYRLALDGGASKGRTAGATAVPTAARRAS